MEYVYTALLLHAAKKEINEAHVSAVLKAAGIEADGAKVKALVASVANVDIDEAIKQAAMAPVAAVAAAPVAEGKKEEKKEDTAKAAEAAAEGLGSLFG
jgi:large subunit ribosomal protein L12